MTIDIWQLGITGATTGAGAAVGAYLSNLLLLRHLEKFEKSLKRGKGK